MKKSKKKSKKKNLKNINYIKYCIITVLIILVMSGIYFFLTAEDNETRLTVLEKQWIMKNKKTLIDINVPNNLDILADNGEGVLFDFVNLVSKETELEFNKKSYNYPSDNTSLNGLSLLILDSKDKTRESDVLIAEDSYILLGTKDEKVLDLNEIHNKKIGVLKENYEVVQAYIPSCTYTNYQSSEELASSLAKNKVDFVIAPRSYILKEAIENKLYINYSFSNLTNKIVLRMSNDKRLSSIMNKYMDSFKNEKYLGNVEEEFMKFYLNNTEMTELDTSKLSRKVYNYGFVKNNNYSMLSNKKLYGFAGEYINALSNMANIEFNYHTYKNQKQLDKAIKNKEVDIAFTYSDYTSETGKYTTNAFNPQLLAISKTNYQITDKEGLQNRKLYTIEDSYLERYLKDNYNSTVTSVKSVKSSIPEDGILILDEIDYYYNKDDLNDYSIILKDNYASNYKFYVKNNEEVLYELINFVITYSNQDEFEKISIDNAVSSLNNEGGFKDFYLAIVIAIVIPVIVLFSLIAITKARKNSKISRKEDVLKYNDMLTSLKNRNYLRARIDEWDEVKITPRTVIIIDLNNLKYVNDNYGQEEGNLLIKKAAAILINTQLEKSEIIRSDGNEFLIYLIGYNKTQVNTYMNKLSREFEKLPHNFGAALGYSMIEDEIKTIDDAINEASIEMRKDKEQNYR